MKLRKNSILVLGLCLLVVTNALSQTRNNSPYSMYGVGTLNDYSNPISFSMGGVGIAFQSDASVNPINPASVASFTEKSFIFDAGLIMNSSSLSATGLSEKASYATLNHLLFGFQLRKDWKISFGLIPFSDVGYSFNKYEDHDVIGEINHVYEGTGGLTKVFLTNAFNLSEKLSVGIEAGLFFGKIEKNYLLSVPEVEYIFYTKQKEINNYSDFYFKFGAQYNTNINENLKLTLGVIYSTKTKIETDSHFFTEIVQKPIDGYINTIETLEEISATGQTTIPGVLGFGLMFHQKNYLNLGFDFEKQFWSKFKAPGNEESFKNTTRMAIGAEYIPDKNSIFSYFKRIKYRIGLRYEKTPLYINNTQINEIGISFGVGLPLRRSLSSINIGMEIGQKGKEANDLIKDTFVKFKLGISMHQKWFEQRKYY